MEICSICGVMKKEGVFYASSVVRNEDLSVQKDVDGNPVRVYNIPFKADVQYTRICKYRGEKQGCLNSCNTIVNTETFEYRAGVVGVKGIESYIPMAQEIKEDLKRWGKTDG